MNNPNRYRTVEVSGTPWEMGRQIGEAAREEVRGFCEVAMRQVNRTVNIARESALKVARECTALAEAYSRDMVDELRGMAESAGVSLDELMLLQVRNQLQPDQDSACTALSLARPLHAARLVAQNWDADPLLDACTIVLIRRPKDKPAFISVTQAGLIAYMGFNEAGIGLCVNTLPAPSRRLGVPHYFTVRGIFESTALDGAVEAVRRADRAIPANIVLTTPEGPADLEVTIDAVRVLRPEKPGRLTHTNHCLHPEIAALNDQFPELIQSHARQQRIDALLDAADGELTVEQVKGMLRDHDGYPRSICRHASDDPRFGFWETVFSIIIEPDARTLHVTRGTPCNHPYETYPL